MSKRIPQQTRRGRLYSRLLPVVLTLLLPACVTGGPTQVQAVTAIPRQTVVAASFPTLAAHSVQPPTSTVTVTPLLPYTATRTKTVTVTATTAPSFELCSPLEGIRLDEMGGPDLLKNPFQAPRPGMDDGHHGADFAYWSRGDHKEMLGLPVYSVLNGRVAGVIQNRSPYGNAILIETSLDEFPSKLQNPLAAPTPAPTIQPAPSLYCPADPVDYASRRRSLYLLYAHLNQTPTLSIGQNVTCGQQVGEVGTTGKSVNPHLHLETRVGPSGATFPQMAHYDTSASDAEMATYCTWRVSGLFQMFDPMQLLSLQP